MSAGTLSSKLQAATSGPDGPLEAMSKAEAKKARLLKINQAVLEFICGTGIPPTLVDSVEWASLVHAFDPVIDTYKSTSFVDVYIPAEAARITDEAIKKLTKMKNLTISYDGGTTKAVESIYTIHVTTPISREPYFITGDESSGVSHTGSHIAEKILEVCA